jgi:ketosteroid isomerase-like protein
VGTRDLRELRSDDGRDRAIALVASEVQGRVSGATVPWRYWAVVSFRNGKALRIEWYTDRAEAVQAAGHQD